MIFIFQLTCDLPISPDTRIYGSWSWVYSSGWWGSSSPPPPVLIKFDTTGIYSFYRNDSLIDTKMFTISYEKTGYPSPETTNVVKFVPVQFSNFFQEYIVTGQYEIHIDTLKIWYGTGMGPCISTYLRAKSIPWRG
jgi:hypothetical protein